MKTVEDVRHARLQWLRRHYGSTQALADALGKSHSQLSQLLTRSRHSTTGKPREIGKAFAREVEAKLQLLIGVMDTPLEELPDVALPPTQAPPPGRLGPVEDELAATQLMLLAVISTHPDQRALLGAFDGIVSGARMNSPSGLGAAFDAALSRFRDELARQQG